MRIADLSCKNSIWNVGKSYMDAREDSNGKEIGLGSIVKAIDGDKEGDLGMIVYFSGMGDCCISDLREGASRINGYDWREFSENLELKSISPLTKGQESYFDSRELYDLQINKQFLDLDLKHLYIFGNSDKEQIIHGNLLYSLGGNNQFVSWLSDKDYGQNSYKERNIVLPYNPQTGKVSKVFHNSKYIDAFIKESILEGIFEKESKIADLAF